MSARQATKLPTSGPIGVFVPVAELRALMANLKHQRKQLQAMNIDDRAGASAIASVAAMCNRPKRLPLRGEV